MGELVKDMVGGWMAIVSGCVSPLACGGQADGNDDERQAVAEEEPATDSASVVGVGGPQLDTLQATDRDGVCVFVATGSGGALSAMTGVPQIVDGCLQVGPHVVVWPDDAMSTVNGLIQGALTGVETEYVVGGGLLAAHEGQPTVPDLIAEHCPQAGSVWLASGAASQR